MHMLHIGITKYIAEAVHQTQVIPVKKLRDRVTSRWKQIFTNTKVPTEMHHKTGNIPISSMKAKDWQIVDTFCFIPFALDIDGPEDLKIILLSYSFIVRILYMSDEILQKSPGCNYENIKLIFLRAYARLFNDDSSTFNIHQFYHFLSYRLKMGPVWKYSTAKYESLYARTRTGYRGNTPNVPVQLLESAHLQQAAKHCAITKNASHCP